MKQGAEANTRSGGGVRIFGFRKIKQARCGMKQRAKCMWLKMDM